jgi:hypothetical protein
LWAGLLPADLTLHDFKELFKAEFAVENHDKLMGELLKATQKGLVGEYATGMMDILKFWIWKRRLACGTSFVD